MSGKMSKKGKNPGAVDNWLDNLELYRKNVAYDETCLFRAVSEQLFDCQVFHERVRKESIDYGRDHYDEFKHLVHTIEDWQKHLDMLEKHMVICGNLEINLISRKYYRDVLIFHANQQHIYDVTKRGLSSLPLMLCLMDDDHYDAVYRKEQICNAGFCQSLVYKILYENVFKIPEVDNIVNAMLYEKTPVINQVELEGKKQGSDGINDFKSEELGNVVIAPFPFKVAKALDPSIYRNIEYDSWGEVRRELRLGDWYYGDDKLKLGTRCILKNPELNETLDCYIQELHKDNDKCVVYLTKFAEKRVVKYTDLCPESDAKPWPLPYRFSKNLVINNTNTTQLAPMDKVKSMRKRNKERKQTSKSVSDLTNVNDGMDSVSAYVGVPLQMQNNNINNNNNVEANKEATTQTVGLALHNAEGLITPVTPDINYYPQRYQWEQVQWPTPIQYAPPPENIYYPQSPGEFIWPQTQTNPFMEYKPMMASAPVTPNVVPYHDTSYPFFFNYQVDHYSPPQYPLTPTTPGTPMTHLVQKSSDTSASEMMTKQMIPTTPQQHSSEYQVQTSGGAIQNAQNVSYVSHTPQPMEVYQHQHQHQQVLNLPPGTPVIYTTLHPPPEVEMVMPSSPIAMYTPTTPGDVPYIHPPGYVTYSNEQSVPPVPWYQPHQGFPAYNTQGFIFPPPNSQAK